MNMNMQVIPRKMNVIVMDSQRKISTLWAPNRSPSIYGLTVAPVPSLVSKTALENVTMIDRKVSDAKIQTSIALFVINIDASLCGYTENDRSVQ
jgi:hypothetical protein